MTQIRVEVRRPKATQAPTRPVYTNVEVRHPKATQAQTRPVYTQVEVWRPKDHTRNTETHLHHSRSTALHSHTRPTGPRLRPPGDTDHLPPGPLPPLGCSPSAWIRYYTDWLPRDTNQLTRAIRAALSWTPPARTAPVFRFEWSHEAAMHNYTVLQASDFDLHQIIHADPLSPLKPGSEWRPVALLDPIFEDHDLWPNVKGQFTHGFHWPLQPIDETDRLRLVDAGIEYGNHKSAQQANSELIPSLKSEVTKGWQLPLPIFNLVKIPGVIVAPLGYVHQFGTRHRHRRTCRQRSHNTRSILQPLQGSTILRQQPTARRTAHPLRVRFRPELPRPPRRRTTPGLPISTGPPGKTRFQIGIPPRTPARRHRKTMHSHHSWPRRSTLRPDVTPPNFRRRGRPTRIQRHLVGNHRSRQRARTTPPGLLETLPESMYKDKIGSPKLEHDNTPFATALPLRVTPETDGNATANNYIDDIIGSFVLLPNKIPTGPSKH